MQLADLYLGVAEPQRDSDYPQQPLTVVCSVKHLQALGGAIIHSLL